MSYCVCHEGLQAHCQCLGQTSHDSEVEELAPGSPLIPQIPALPPGEGGQRLSRGRSPPAPAINSARSGIQAPRQDSSARALSAERGCGKGPGTTWPPAQHSASSVASALPPPAPSGSHHAAGTLQASISATASRPLQPRRLQIAGGPCAAGSCGVSSPSPGPGSFPLAYATLANNRRSEGDEAAGAPSPLLTMRMPSPWCVANEQRHGATLLGDWKEQQRVQQGKSDVEGSSFPDGMTGFEAVDMEQAAIASGVMPRIMSRAPSPAVTPDMVTRDIRDNPHVVASLVSKAL